MPHFTLALDQGGGGPIIKAVVGVSQPRGVALADQGQPVPTPVTIRALVDTGASHTCIDPMTLQALGLTPSGKIDCLSPTTGAAPVSKDLYDVSLLIFSQANQPPLLLSTLPVMASELFAAQGIHALIGRDILKDCLLHYNGTASLFTLAF